jgi:GPH family glycoside/pentoside/hexuronide:cation symporter
VEGQKGCHGNPPFEMVVAKGYKFENVCRLTICAPLHSYHIIQLLEKQTPAHKKRRKKMEEKRYLKWYNKVGYGSGDMAANCFYGIISSFVMIYLTDTVGLNSAVIGSLILLSKIFDGVTDIFFGNLIDKTHTKMGKARPWMLFSEIGNAIVLVLLFSIPAGIGQTAQYVYFFITYTLINAIFYTANNVAYSSLTSLITKNPQERVQMGSIRFMFSMATNIAVSYATMALVGTFGGGAAGWRGVAILYACIALVVNAISVFSVKELPEEELNEGTAQNVEVGEKISFVESMKLLFSNKYFIIIALFYVALYFNTGLTSIGTYYCTYVLGSPSLLGSFSMANMLPMIIGLVFTPWIISRAGSMYKVNLGGYLASLIFRVGFIVFGYMSNVTMMLVCSAIAALLTSPTAGDMNALISASAEYTLRTKGKHIEGAMFSCASVGIKVGGGLASAVTGFLLSAGGYVAGAEVQPASCISMLNFMYLVLPLLLALLISFLLFQLKVEKANTDWDAAHKTA